MLLRKSFIIASLIVVLSACGGGGGGGQNNSPSNGAETGNTASPTPNPTPATPLSGAVEGPDSIDLGSKYKANVSSNSATALYEIAYGPSDLKVNSNGEIEWLANIPAFGGATTVTYGVLVVAGNERVSVEKSITVNSSDRKIETLIGNGAYTYTGAQRVIAKTTKSEGFLEGYSVFVLDGNHFRKLMKVGDAWQTVWADPSYYGDIESFNLKDLNDDLFDDVIVFTKTKIYKLLSRHVSAINQELDYPINGLVNIDFTAISETEIVDVDENGVEDAVILGRTEEKGFGLYIYDLNTFNEIAFYSLTENTSLFALGSFSSSDQHEVFLGSGMRVILKTGEKIPVADMSASFVKAVDINGDGVDEVVAQTSGSTISVIAGAEVKSHDVSEIITYWDSFHRETRSCDTIKTLLVDSFDQSSTPHLYFVCASETPVLTVFHAVGVLGMTEISPLWAQSYPLWGPFNNSVSSTSVSGLYSGGELERGILTLYRHGSMANHNSIGYIQVVGGTGNFVYTDDESGGRDVDGTLSSVSFTGSPSTELVEINGSSSLFVGNSEFFSSKEAEIAQLKFSSPAAPFDDYVTRINHRLGISASVLGPFAVGHFDESGSPQIAAMVRDDSEYSVNLYDFGSDTPKTKFSVIQPSVGSPYYRELKAIDIKGDGVNELIALSNNTESSGSSSTFEIYDVSDGSRAWMKTFNYSAFGYDYLDNFFIGDIDIDGKSDLIFTGGSGSFSDTQLNIYTKFNGLDFTSSFYRLSNLSYISPMLTMPGEGKFFAAIQKYWIQNSQDSEREPFTAYNLYNLDDSLLGVQDSNYRQPTHRFDYFISRPRQIKGTRNASTCISDNADIDVCHFAIMDIKTGKIVLRSDASLFSGAGSEPVAHLLYIDSHPIAIMTSNYGVQIVE